METSPLPSSVGQALLASRHPQTIEEITHCLWNFSMGMDLCVDMNSGVRKLNRVKFDAVIVDFTLGEQALRILQQVRVSRSNQSSITFAIVSSKKERHKAFSSGANFVISRPLSTEKSIRILQAGHQLILWERRRYFRCAVGITVFVTPGSGLELTCRAINIAEGGMAIQTPHEFRPGDRIRLRWHLPNTGREVSVRGEICWADECGRAGLKFLNLAQEDQADLREWLTERMDERIRLAAQSQLTARPVS